MGFGGGIGYNPAEERKQRQAELAAERAFRKQEAEEARSARLEEEKLRLALERAAKEEVYEKMEAEKDEIRQQEEEAALESAGQDRKLQSIMSFFGERPGVTINKGSDVSA